MNAELDNRFSLRHGLSRPSGGLIYEEFPERALSGLINYFRNWPSSELARLQREICYQLDFVYNPDRDWSQERFHLVSEFFRDQFKGPDWYRAYDACELVWRLWHDDEERDRYENFLNQLLGRNHSGYEMREGKIERVGSRVADEVVASARSILTDQRLAGPNEQFLKAIAFFNQRPKPDLENAVKEAIGAAEGLARVVTGKDSILLSDALKKWQSEGKIPATLRKATDGIYAYRGDTEGVTHGKVGARQVAVAEAEFILHCSAAIIVYVAQLHGYSVT